MQHEAKYYSGTDSDIIEITSHTYDANRCGAKNVRTFELYFVHKVCITFFCSTFLLRIFFLIFEKQEFCATLEWEDGEPHQNYKS